jgi:hypothetical protein
MEQLHSGTNRYCRVKKKYMSAFGSPCNRYVSLWEKDLFGEFLYTKMKREKKLF